MTDAQYPPPAPPAGAPAPHGSHGASPAGPMPGFPAPGAGGSVLHVSAADDVPAGVPAVIDFSQTQNLIQFRFHPLHYINWLVLVPLAAVLLALVPWYYRDALPGFLHYALVWEAGRLPLRVMYLPGAALFVYAVGRAVLGTCYKRLSMSYRITSQYVEIRTRMLGFLSYERETISFLHIHDVDDQSLFLQRFFNIGTVRLAVSDPNVIRKRHGAGKDIAGGEFTPDRQSLPLPGVPDVHRVTNLIRKILTSIEAAKTVRFG